MAEERQEIRRAEGRRRNRSASLPNVLHIEVPALRSSRPALGPAVFGGTWVDASTRRKAMRPRRGEETSWRTVRRRQSISTGIALGSNQVNRTGLIEELRNYYGKISDELLDECETYDEVLELQELYSDEALLRRESIRFSASVNDILKKIVRIIDKDSSGSIEQREYIDFHIKLQKLCLGGEGLGGEESVEIAAREWAFDSFGRDRLSHSQIALSIFQLCDSWVSKIDEDDYRYFLKRVYESISRFDARQGKRVARELDDIDTFTFRKEGRMPCRLTMSQRRCRIQHDSASDSRTFLRRVFALTNETGIFHWTEELADLLCLDDGSRKWEEEKLNRIVHQKLKRIGSKIMERGKLHHRRRESHVWASKFELAGKYLDRNSISKRPSSATTNLKVKPLRAKSRLRTRNFTKQKVHHETAKKSARLKLLRPCRRAKDLPIIDLEISQKLGNGGRPSSAPLLRRIQSKRGAHTRPRQRKNVRKRKDNNAHRKHKFLSLREKRDERKRLAMEALTAGLAREALCAKPRVSAFARGTQGDAIRKYLRLY